VNQVETVEGSETIAQALAQPTLCAAFQTTAAAHPQQTALTVADAPDLTWGDYAARVEAIAAGLWSLGVRADDCVAILLANRPEFHLVDTAALHLGAIPFSIYHTNPSEQIVPLLENSGARVVITEPGFLPVIEGTRALGAAIDHIVLVGGESEGTIPFDELATRSDPDFDFEATWRAVTPELVAVLVYTSGTTGAPKGVEHTHGGLMFGQNSFNTLAPVSPGGRVVSYLPMAHIAERMISHYASLTFGYTIACCPDPKALAATLAATRPTRLFGVPRIYEKLRDGALAMIERDQALHAELETALAAVRATHAEGQPLTGHAPCTDPQAFAPVRAALGLDAAEYLTVAAAPTPVEVLVFFHAIGLPVTELWGMSECVLSTSNPPGRVKLGSVGYALPRVEVRLADDGEIMVRGPQVTRGYRRDPERTRESISEDGWLSTGDIAVADEEGYLKIVDRKKELIINSAGKNMAPTHIEGTVKEESRLIANVVAIGDARPYVTALIVLDPEAAGRFAGEHGLPAELAELAATDEMQAEIAAAIARGNDRLARVEQIKAHAILGVEWLPGSEELTPTQKLRRKPINEKYAEEIDALYAR
jgi:long-chain acyl-CoA synthetase